MNEENIYAAPASNPESPNLNGNSQVLAGRLSRLGSAILDGLIMMVIITPIMFLTGYFNRMSLGAETSFIEQLPYNIASIVVFILLNIKFLLSNGQTIGKKIVGIKITGLSGESLSLLTISKRYGFYFLVGQIPFVGPFVGIINILFIFGKDKRCLHDLVAGTKVIKA